MDIKEIKEKIGKLSILIVDDEIDLLKSVEKFMGKFFEKVDTASNGEEALERYKQGNFDVLMSDIQMPKLNGDELVKTIRKNDNNTFIVILTGTPDEENDHLKGICDSVLVKPIDMNGLMVLLNEIIEKKGL